MRRLLLSVPKWVPPGFRGSRELGPGIGKRQGRAGPLPDLALRQGSPKHPSRSQYRLRLKKLFDLRRYFSLPFLFGSVDTPVSTWDLLPHHFENVFPPYVRRRKSYMSGADPCP